jgi:predicted permease
MFMARSSARRREIAVRVALGTSRWRLMRQLLIESVSIATAGGIGGVLLAFAGTRLLTTMQLPIPISLHLNLDPDWRVFLFTFGISVLTGIFFGLAPAIQATRHDVVADLKAGDSDGGGSRLIFRNGLVVAQLALSLVLLIGASLLTRSLASATRIDLGFDAGRYAVVQFNLGMYGYDNPGAEKFFQDIQQRFSGVAGVEAVTLADRTPMSLNINMTTLFPTATPAPEDKPITIDNTSVEPNFFDAMHVPIVEGRAIGAQDTPDTPRVAVVSEAAAHRLWPRESAVGKQMRSQSGRIIQIVGVARDYKVRTVGEEPRPMIHFARRQIPGSSTGVLVRTRAPARLVLPALRAEISALDAELVPFQLTTLEDETAHSLIPVRAGAAILAGLGAFTVFLAGVGLYGLIAYSVSRRTREIGTRIALGATPRGIVKQVVQEGSKILSIGAVVGLAGAAVLNRFLQSLLYGISSFDAASFAIGVLVISAVALSANVLPALAASRIDPIRALKVD